MDSLSPDIAKKLLSRNLANLAQRIQRGEKLSKAELVLLQNMAAQAGETPAVAGDFSELARILQISRRTMNRWRKHPDAPPPGPHGLEEVKPWLDFKERNNLNGDLPKTPLEESPKARKMLAEVEERELRVAIKKREYVSYEEVREVWNRNAAKAKDLLRNKFEMELPPILSGLDAVAIQAECQKAIDEVLTIMSTGDGAVNAACGLTAVAGGAPMLYRAWPPPLKQSCFAPAGLDCVTSRYAAMHKQRFSRFANQSRSMQELAGSNASASRHIAGPEHDQAHVIPLLREIARDAAVHDAAPSFVPA